MAVSTGPLLVLAVVSINLAAGPTGPQVVAPAYVSEVSGKPLRINYAQKLKPDDVDAAIRSWGEFPATFQAIREEYPADYQRMLEFAAYDIHDGRSGTTEEILERSQAATRMGKLRSLGAARAPALAELARAYAKLLRDLKADNVEACASLGSYGSPPPDSAGRSRTVKADLDAIGNLEVRSAKAAAAGGAVRRGTLTAAEQAAWSKAMDAHFAKASELWAGPAFDSASTAEQCDATVALFAGAADLPEATSANVMAQILRLDTDGMPATLSSLRENQPGPA
ncbi:MAG TPA: hypothetical protein VF079_04710 [Sphingomicrobium sp.]